MHSSHFERLAAVLELVVVPQTVVVRALVRRFVASVVRTTLAAAVGPTHAVRDRDLGARRRRALGSAAMGPAESARLTAAVAVVDEALVRAAWKCGKRERRWMIELDRRPVATTVSR